MSRGISCEGGPTFKLSLVLLCSLLLLWLVVLLLFVWLRIIQKEVDRAYKDCRINFKLDENLTTPEIEKISEVETSKRSWEYINRTFAYAPGDLEGDEKIPVFEELPGMEEQSTADVKFALVQEPANPEIVKVSSCIQITDDSPSVLFLSGEHPGEKEGQERIFSNMRNPGNLYEKTSPVKKEYSLILIDADHTFPNSNEDWPKDETFEQQSLSVEADIVEMKEKSVGKRLSESTSNANEISSEEQLPSEITSGVSFESVKTATRHLGDENRVSRLEDEAETLLPTATAAKRKHISRKRSKRRAKEKRKTEDESTPPIDHNHKTMQVNKQAEDECKNKGQDWKIQADVAQDSGCEHGTYQSSVQDGHQKNLPRGFFENDHDKERPDVSVNHFQSRKKRDAECEEVYNVIDPPESRQWPTDFPDNEDHSKHDDDATNEKVHHAPNITEEVYSNIDNNNDVEPFYVNGHYLKRLLEQGFFQDVSHIYSNADELRQESTTFNDNPAFDNADEGPAYVNLAKLRDA